jgi:hypothetical protein
VGRNYNEGFLTVGNFFKSFKEAPGKLLSRFGVGAPEEIEMDSVEVNIFENPHYSFDPPTAPTESASNILVGYDLGFKYASGVKNGSAKTISSATEFSAALSHFPE